MGSLERLTLTDPDPKQDVFAFWQAAACGESLYLDAEGNDYERQASRRYGLEPYIEAFAGFSDAVGKDVLEIGVGLGADHQRFAEAGARLTGIDLTDRAIEHTGRRLAQLGLKSFLRVADAEALPFPDDAFDLVYSWGVIHHLPNTAQAAREIMRVLRPGGQFCVMVYHRKSVVGFMLWLRYALLRGRITMSLSEVYAEYLESPGTKAFSRSEAVALFAEAQELEVRVVLTHGDLLEGPAGQRHRGIALAVARRIWPRRLIRTLFPDHGLYLLIKGRKPTVG